MLVVECVIGAPLSILSPLDSLTVVGPLVSVAVAISTYPYSLALSEANVRPYSCEMSGAEDVLRLLVLSGVRTYSGAAPSYM